MSNRKDPYVATRFNYLHAIVRNGNGTQVTPVFPDRAPLNDQFDAVIGTLQLQNTTTTTYTVAGYCNIGDLKTEKYTKEKITIKCNNSGQPGLDPHLVRPVARLGHR